MVNSTHENTSTQRPAARIAGLDALRALAIIGMVYMHVSPTGWFTAVPFPEKAAVFSWFESIASNRAMSLFVLTAGISVALLSRRPGAGRQPAIRAGVLFLISLTVDQLAGLNVSILEYYSLWLLLLIPLLRLPMRALVSAAAVGATVLPLFSFIVMNYGQDWPISPFSGGAEATVGLRLLITPADWPAKLKNLLIGGGFQTPYALPLLLAGLAVGRLDLRSASVRRRLALTWYAAHLVFLHGTGRMPPYAFSLFAGMILAVLVVSPLWCRRFPRGPLEGLTHRVVLLAGSRTRPSGPLPGAGPGST